MSNKFFLFFFTLLLLVSDLVSKYLAQVFLVVKIPLLGNFLSLELYKNPGIAFSFPLSGIFLKVVTLALIFGIIYYYWKEERRKQNIWIDIAFSLVLAGAIGNGVERIFLGEVTDFIAVQYFSVFNLADAFITIGGILYIVFLLNLFPLKIKK